METLWHGMLWNAVDATLLALAVLIVSRLCRPGPTLRHALWLLVLGKLVCPPVAVQPFSLRTVSLLSAGFLGIEPRENEQQAAHDTQQPARPASAAVPPLDPGATRDASLLHAAPGPASRRPDALPRLGAPQDFLTRPRDPYQNPEPPAAPPREARGPPVSWLLGIQAVGSLLVVLWHLHRIAGFRRLLRATRPAAKETILACAQASRRLGLGKNLRVRVGEPGLSPFLWALGSPVVVLPRQLDQPSHRHLLGGVLAHELAHIKRRDHWLCWLPLIVSVVYWWLPTFWVAWKAMRRAADQAADMWAASSLGTRKGYAESLLSTLSIVNDCPLPSPVLGQGLGGRIALERRLVSIMKDPLNLEISRGSWVILLALAALVLPVTPRSASGQGGLAVSPPSAEPQPDSELPPVPETEDPTAIEPGGAAPVAALSPARSQRSTEQRLSELESKVDLILQELRSLRRSSSPPRGLSGRATQGGGMSQHSQVQGHTSGTNITPVGPEARENAMRLLGTLMSASNQQVSPTPSKDDAPAKGGYGASNQRPSQYAQDPYREEKHGIAVHRIASTGIAADRTPEQEQRILEIDREFQKKMQELEQWRRNALRDALKGSSPTPGSSGTR